MYNRLSFFRNRLLSLPVSEMQLSTRESPYLLFLFLFFLKMVIKREDVTSYCELQTCFLVLLQLPCCLETTMALQHLTMFDVLLNPQLLKAFERNKHRKKRMHTPSAASHHHSLSHQEGELIVGKGVSPCKGPKRRTCGCTRRELRCI